MSPFDNLVLTFLLLSIAFFSLGIAYVIYRTKTSIASGFLRAYNAVKLGLKR